MKIAVVKYSTQNLGDDIQSLALERLLPRVDLRVDRDDLSPAHAWGDDVRWILNGWYATGAHRIWGPPGRARCLFVGFHAHDPQVVPKAPTLPVGCRDPWTLGLCARQGIDAWLSYCATLTFEPPAGRRGQRVLLVDVPEAELPRLPPEVAAGRRLTHYIGPGADRRAAANRRLHLYARARWVVTTRLHVLLPCAAMGTPVVFIRPPYSENRYTGYTHLAWRITDAPWDRPRPKLDPEIVHSMARPLRHCIEQFLQS